MKSSLVLRSVCALGLAGCTTSEALPILRERPNILLIVANDLGYSDLGIYGSEIPTPNLDGLALSGLRATNFYVSSESAPTRAMLLTGVDNHVAGFGAFRGRLAANQRGQPGYAGRLSEGVVTVASLLRDAGYHTVVAGEWGLGGTPESLPAARGFERSFVLHDEAASHWGDMKSAVPGRQRAHYTEDGRDVAELPSDYFSTRSFTDFVIENIAEAYAYGRPFFAVLSLQAPHGPLAAERPRRFAGRYDAGYDAIRKARLLRMKRMGLVREEVKPYPGIPTVPMWSALDREQQREQARRMELYASMVESLDIHVGRLLDYLREIDEYEDTLIVFLSDNGAEPGDRGPAGMDARNREWYARHFPESDFENWGRQGSFSEYGPAWAQVGMVPFRLFKGTHAEGGIRSPLIASGPGVAGRGKISRKLLHVMDLAPTFLELANVAHPREYGGRAVAPLQGMSLVPLLAGGRHAGRRPHDWLGFEFAGDRAIRRGPWKLVWMPPPFGPGKWRLYRLDRDPTELFDRSEGKPDEKRALLAIWEEYARANGVVSPEAAQKSSPSDM